MMRIWTEDFRKTRLELDMWFYYFRKYLCFSFPKLKKFFKIPLGKWVCTNPYP